jgi:hypothetical protein
MWEPSDPVRLAGQLLLVPEGRSLTGALRESLTSIQSLHFKWGETCRSNSLRMPRAIIARR